ncbi:MAG: rRNA pseudouridine synthase [Clostridia bacterium]|nr:rRNA pseudouridine synthase [Clostridia bacterium]MBQ8393608.1 rRNA pseudouridine synthase [Clostridia bacterium]
MRVDKFLSEMGKATRTESAKLAKTGKITVNGSVIKRSDVHIDPEKDELRLFGEIIYYKKYTYIMMNKPEGYVSATEDGRDKTVLDLLTEEERRKNLFPCGRLDKNTLGLIILTNDGDSAHRLLSPKHHVPKTYAFKSKYPLSSDDVNRLETGVDIGGYVTKPCTISLDSDGTGGKITITEGKYHQIKLMLDAVKNKIIYLERLTFGNIKLDENLKRGEWRHLTSDEESLLIGK